MPRTEGDGQTDWRTLIFSRKLQDVLGCLYLQGATAAIKGV